MRNSRVGPPDWQQRARTRSGDDTERCVAELNEICLLAGVARIRKMPTPWRPIRPGSSPGTMLCVPAEKSGADYRGHIIGGPAAYVEAKRLTENRLNFASRLPQHQRDDLAHAANEGQVAVLLILAGESLVRPIVYALPWYAVAAVIERGGKSLGPDDLESWAVRPRAPYLERWASGRVVNFAGETIGVTR